jgi:DnaJ domain.
MPQSTLERPAALLVTSSPQPEEHHQQASSSQKGFGGGKTASGGKRKGRSKRSQTLSKADWGPMGKHPDLDAIVARQRLHLPRSGRLTEAEVNQAWKRCASEHHPDRGGEHHTMQLVNGARDLLLGRQLS